MPQQAIQIRNRKLDLLPLHVVALHRLLPIVGRWQLRRPAKENRLLPPLRQPRRWLVQHRRNALLARLLPLPLPNAPIRRILHPNALLARERPIHLVSVQGDQEHTRSKGAAAQAEQHSNAPEEQERLPPDNLVRASANIAPPVRAMLVQQCRIWAMRQCNHVQRHALVMVPAPHNTERHALPAQRDRQPVDREHPDIQDKDMLAQRPLAPPTDPRHRHNVHRNDVLLP